MTEGWENTDPAAFRCSIRCGAAESLGITQHFFNKKSSGCYRAYITAAAATAALAQLLLLLLLKLLLMQFIF